MVPPPNRGVRNVTHGRYRRTLPSMLIAMLVGVSLTATADAKPAASSACRLSVQPPKFHPGDKWHRYIQLRGSFRCPKPTWGVWNIELVWQGLGPVDAWSLEYPITFQPGKLYQAHGPAGCPHDEMPSYYPATGGLIYTELQLLGHHDRVIARADSRRVASRC